LLERRLQLQDLPHETRKRLVQQLVRLLIEKLNSPARTVAKEQSHE